MVHVLHQEIPIHPIMSDHLRNDIFHVTLLSPPDVCTLTGKVLINHVYRFVVVFGCFGLLINLLCIVVTYAL